MKQSLARIAAVGFVAGLLLLPSVAFADDDTSPAASSPSPSPTVSSSLRQSAEQKLNQQLQAMKQERQTVVSDVKSDLKEKLDSAKLKVCQQHQTQINGIMKQMDDRRQTAYDKITQILTAVEKYVTDKNITVSDYSSLVATAEAAQSAAQTDMQTQQSAPQLNCSDAQPRQDVSDFKTKRADSIDAMKTYRDAVKALISAVKATAGQTTGGSSNAN